MDCIPLHGKGRTVSESLPWAAMDMKGWHRRPRIVYDAPPSLVKAYLPLASAVFAKQYRGPTNEGTSDIVTLGDVGLALDESRTAVVSVEAIALEQLVRTPGESDPIPEWLPHLACTWTAGQCLFMWGTETGWRGCFSEHRMWSSFLLTKNAHVKTPYPKPTVRGWFPQCILDDLTACVGEEVVLEVALTISRLGFDGSPDLVLYRKGCLWLVEVKSDTDRLRETQAEMLSQLSAIEKVKCSICCPAAARKRMLATMEAFHETSDVSS